MYPVIANSKLVVLPSRWEAFGFVCIEAMAFAKPVIATSGSGFSEIIKNNVSGFLVKPDDVEGLANKINYCLSNDMKKIRKAAIKRVNDFSVSNIALEVLKLYKKVIGESNE